MPLKQIGLDPGFQSKTGFVEKEPFADALPPMEANYRNKPEYRRTGEFFLALPPPEIEQKGWVLPVRFLKTHSLHHTPTSHQQTRSRLRSKGSREDCKAMFYHHLDEYWQLE
ncbi:MAG: hypothetical protein P1U89_26220 [Verrucomicrobiales bacterium]|nr:hypothetical protein [Verrucomicrobiales bacterium]